MCHDGRRLKDGSSPSRAARAPRTSSCSMPTTAAVRRTAGNPNPYPNPNPTHLTLTLTLTDPNPNPTLTLTLTLTLTP